MVVNASAPASEVPTFLVDEKTILEEFRGQLRSKIKELSQNYLTRAGQRSFVWYSNEPLECHGETIEERMALASVQQSVSAESITFELRGCGHRLLLKETFVGANVAQFTLKKYLDGELPEGEIQRYLLEDGARIGIFEWRKVAMTTALYFMQQRFLDIYNRDQQRQYKLQGYRADYHAHGFGLEVDMLTNDARLNVDWSGDDVRIYNSDFKLVSINSFLTSYSHGVQASTLNFVGMILQHLMKGLPSTEFVSSAGQNSRLLDELRITYTRLLNSLELNLVRQFVQELIAAVENGLLQITDNRPESR